MEKRTGPKPAYTTAQNVGYMVTLAWREQKSVLWLCLALALLHVAISLTELYLAPLVLGKVEAAAPLAELLLTIAAMAGALALLRGLRGLHRPKRPVRQGGAAGGPHPKDHPQVPHHLLPQRGKPGAGKGKGAGHAGAVHQRLRRGGCLAGAHRNRPKPFGLWGVPAAVPQPGPGAGGHRRRERRAQLPVRPPGGQMVLRPPEGGGRAGPADELHPEKGRRPGRPEGHPPLRHGGLAEGRVHLGAGPVPALCPPEQRVYLWGDLAEVFLTLARNGAAYGYLLALTLREGLPAAQFLLYVTAVGNFTTWVTGILQAFGELHRFSLELCSVRQYLEAPEQFRFETGKPLSPSLDQPYGLRLEDVSFRYPGAEEDTLSHIDLTVAPGEKLAIVGTEWRRQDHPDEAVLRPAGPHRGTGAPQRGGHPGLQPPGLLPAVLHGIQDFSVFDTTFADNVTQIPESADTAGMEDAVKRAGLWERYRSLPQGGATHIGTGVYEDGIQLSGGELQRLMLARALYKNGPIIILDEPTAALDPIAEHQLYLRYSQLTQGRTSFYISHRLASTRFCDRILLLDQGQIVEEGTHQSLLELGGKYAGLFEIQSQYYKEGNSHG